MLEKLKEMLAGSNQFASGGLLLMILGGLTVWLRAVPERIWYWIVRQTTMVVTVKDEDDAFIWVKEWFLEQKFLKHVRHLDLDTSVRGEKVAMLPAPGKHWFWFDGWPFEVWFSRTEGAGESYKRRIESFTFRTPGRNRAILERLVRAIAECHNRKMGVQSYLVTTGGNTCPDTRHGCLSLWCWMGMKGTFCWRMSPGFLVLASATRGSEFLTIAAICFTDRLARERHRLFPHSAVTLDCPSMW